MAVILIVIALLIVWTLITTGWSHMSDRMKSVSKFTFIAAGGGIALILAVINDHNAFSSVINIITIVSISAAVLVVGIILGLIRYTESDESIYIEKRNRLLKFLFKWGGIYVAVSFVIRVVAYEMLDGREAWEIAWVVSRTFSLPVFVFITVTLWWQRR